MSRGAEGDPPAGAVELGREGRGQRRRSEFNSGERDGSGSGQLWAVAAGRHQSTHRALAPDARAYVSSILPAGGPALSDDDIYKIHTHTAPAGRSRWR